MAIQQKSITQTIPERVKSPYFRPFFQVFWDKKIVIEGFLRRFAG